MKIKFLMLAAMAGTLAVPSFAYDHSGRLSIGGAYGEAWPNRPEAFQDNTEHGRMWSGNIKYGVAKSVALVLSYANISLKDKNTSDETLLQPIIMSARYYAFHNSPINPYLTAGAGISGNKREITGGSSDKWTKFAAQGGVGIEFFITPSASIGAEGLYHHIVGTGDESPLRLLSAVGTVNLYFGSTDETRKARAEADKAKKEADAAKAEQDRLRQENANANANANSSQLTAEQAKMEADRQAAAAAAATAAAASAQQQMTDAQRKTQEMQAQAQAAQAEVQNIQDMIARKEVPPIMFATGSNKLLPQSSAALDQMSQIITKYPNLKVRVEGHTDSVGDDASNMRLSQRRADAVKEYLSIKASSTANQIDAIGLGESKPVASNDTNDGRSQNRRVEFLFVLPN